MTSTQPGTPPSAQPFTVPPVPWYLHRYALATWACLAILAIILFCTSMGAEWRKSIRAWGNTTTVVSAPAQAASAPEAAASAAAPAAQPAAEVETYTVEKSDTNGLAAIFGKGAFQSVCDLNKAKYPKLASSKCNHIEAGWVLDLPAGVEARAKKPGGKKVVKTDKPKASIVVLPKTNDEGEILYRVVGTAPLNGCGKKDVRTISEEAWEVLGLSEDDRVHLRSKADLVKGPRLNITEAEGRIDMPSGMRLEQVTFCRKGKVVALGPMRTAWADGHPPVKGEKFVLPSGKVLVWMRNCYNWVTLKEGQPVPRAVPLPPQEGPPVVPPLAPEPPASAPDLPVPAPLPPVQETDVGRYDDWDLGVYVGGDRDVGYAGAEGAYYPGEGIHWKEWGRYAIGVGGFVNFWEGQTPNDYRFGGRYGAIGISQKWSTYKGRDVGLKFPTIGLFDEHGHDSTGNYRQNRRATVLCASLSYNDASREKAGETSVPEWQLWTSFCDPLSQVKSHSWQGQALNTADMQDIRHIVSVGGRVFLSKDLTGLLGEDSAFGRKVQPFVEAGANKTSPFPYSAHLYLGLRTVNKVFGCGVGPHYSDATNTTILGFTCNYDYGRHQKLGVEQERWTALTKKLEALGVNVAESDD